MNPTPAPPPSPDAPPVKNLEFKAALLLALTLLLVAGSVVYVLFARGLEMLRRLSLAFEQRMVGKEYVAVVHGHLAQDAGEIDLPLGEDAARRPRQLVDPVHGRRALTRYRVLARLGEGAEACTRVALKPVTGRAHQLRVHLLALGHPIVGDPLYAPPDCAARFSRMHLHATRIAFIHPRSRVPLQLESPVPF